MVTRPAANDCSYLFFQPSRTPMGLAKRRSASSKTTAFADIGIFASRSSNWACAGAHSKTTRRPRTSALADAGPRLISSGPALILCDIDHLGDSEIADGGPGLRSFGYLCFINTFDERENHVGVLADPRALKDDTWTPVGSALLKQ